MARNSNIREVLKKINHPEGEEIRATVVERAALHGDTSAKKIWDEAKTSISVLCAGLVTLLNPEVLVIGGGLLAHSKTLLPTIRDAVQELSMKPSARSVRVEKWSFGEKTCAIGAAFLSIE
jgi:glucokinase